jgi:Tfp pilus assembly protein PilO
MRRDFKLEMRAIVLGLVLLVAADIALAAYSWHFASAPRPQQDLAVLTRNRDLLRADIARAQDIRKKMPAIQKDCDEFEQSLYPAATGYSSVSAELGAIAKKSGLQLESSFRQQDVKGRPLTEVEIEAAVVGSYSGIVHFLNGLQRSNVVYAVQGLTARSENGPQGMTGQVRVVLHIKTYFRTAW